MAPRPFHVEAIDDEYAAVLRAQPGWRRVDAVAEMFAFACEMTEAAVRSQHPEWSDAKVEQEVVRRVGHAAD